MKVMGLRAESSGFNWAICEGTLEAPVLVAANHVEAPRDYSESEGVGDLGSRLRAILTTYSPSVVGLRTPESVSPGQSESARKRLRVEGAMLLMCAQTHLKVETGALKTISASLGVKSAKDFLELDQYQQLNWATYKKPGREAILMAISLL